MSTYKLQERRSVSRRVDDIEQSELHLPSALEKATDLGYRCLNGKTPIEGRAYRVFCGDDADRTIIYLPTLMPCDTIIERVEHVPNLSYEDAQDLLVGDYADSNWTVPEDIQKLGNPLVLMSAQPLRDFETSSPLILSRYSMHTPHQEALHRILEILHRY